MAQEVKEFSELVKDQYTFLMQQLEKVLKDYFDLSSKVKEMHTEIFSLRVSWRRLPPCNASIKSARNVACGSLTMNGLIHENYQSNSNPLLRHARGQELHGI